MRGVPPPCVIDVKKYMYICRELLKDERKESDIKLIITATHTYIITVSLLQLYLSIINVAATSLYISHRHRPSQPNMIENLKCHVNTYIMLIAC